MPRSERPAATSSCTAWYRSAVRAARTRGRPRTSRCASGSGGAGVCAGGCVGVKAALMQPWCAATVLSTVRTSLFWPHRSNFFWDQWYRWTPLGKLFWPHLAECPGRGQPASSTSACRVAWLGGKPTRTAGASTRRGAAAARQQVRPAAGRREGGPSQVGTPRRIDVRVGPGEVGIPQVGPRQVGALVPKQPGRISPPLGTGCATGATGRRPALLAGHRLGRPRHRPGRGRGTPRRCRGVLPATP